MLKPPKKPRPEDEEAIDIEALMGADPMGAEVEDDDLDEYSDDELAAEDPAAPSSSTLDPELMSEFEAFDNPDSPQEARAQALWNFMRLCSSKKAF